MVPDRILTQGERADLVGLAQLASEGGICSRVLAFFLDSVQKHAGVESSAAARRIAGIIEQWDSKGLHMTAGLVSKILLEWAEART
jgi:hypothetical protein